MIARGDKYENKANHFFQKKKKSKKKDNTLYSGAFSI